MVRISRAVRAFTKILAFAPWRSLVPEKWNFASEIMDDKNFSVRWERPGTAGWLSLLLVASPGDDRILVTVSRSSWGPTQRLGAFHVVGDLPLSERSVPLSTERLRQKVGVACQLANSWDDHDFSSMNGHWCPPDVQGHSHSVSGQLRSIENDPGARRRLTQTLKAAVRQWRAIEHPDAE